MLGQPGLVEHDVERVAIADDATMLSASSASRFGAFLPSSSAISAGDRLATTWPAPSSSPFASVTLAILPHDTPISATVPARISPPAVVSFSTSSSRIASPSPRNGDGPGSHASTARAIAAGGGAGWRSAIAAR